MHIPHSQLSKNGGINIDGYRYASRQLFRTAGLFQRCLLDIGASMSSSRPTQRENKFEVTEESKWKEPTFDLSE